MQHLGIQHMLIPLSLQSLFLLMFFRKASVHGHHLGDFLNVDVDPVDLGSGLAKLSGHIWWAGVRVSRSVSVTELVGYAGSVFHSFSSSPTSQESWQGWGGIPPSPLQPGGYLPLYSFCVWAITLFTLGSHNFLFLHLPMHTAVTSVCGLWCCNPGPLNLFFIK